MKSQRAILLAAGLLACTTSAQPTQLGSVTFGTPVCGSDFSHPLSGFNPSDCTSAFKALLDANCVSDLCTIPPRDPNPEGLSGSIISQTVGTCTTDVIFDSGTNGATFNETPVLDAFPIFIAQCTTQGDDHSGLPDLTSTNGALSLFFSPSEGFE
jgi:hypothetical protein